MMAALRARRWPVTSEVLLLELPLLVGALNLLESRRQGRRPHAHGRGLGPRATPSADRAAKSLIHGPHSYGCARAEQAFWARAAMRAVSSREREPEWNSFWTRAPTRAVSSREREPEWNWCSR